MRKAIASGIVALGLTMTGPVVAQEGISPDMPVLLGADEIDYDRDTGRVVASGNVEVSQGDRVLLADEITLDQRTNVVTASGNVRLLEPTGEVVFADYIELRNEMKDGIIENMRVLLTDKSRMAAARARRTGGVRTDMQKAVYSPCELCKDKPGRPPLWQIKANRVVHDQRTHDIEYYDAFLEVFGFPVAYTPYLSHPDPTVKRRSGLLTPRLGNKSELGTIIGTPYYFNIAPDKDATIEPIITTQQGPVLFAEYRQRFTDGEFEFAGSVTRADRTDDAGNLKKNQLRGHIRGKGRFDIDDTWRAGFDLARASDDTYLQRYEFGSQDVLTTRGFTEGFRKRSYAAINAYSFQGLRARDDNDRTPLVLPLIDLNFVSRPSRRGDYWTLDANVMSLTRDDGADSRRLSFKSGWRRPFTGKSGHVFDLSAVAQGDVYFVNDVPNTATPGGPTLDGVTGRFFPQLGIEWRYPLVRESGKARELIEPVAAIIVGPNGGNPDKIPNEDSQAFEFDDTDIFSLNRFTGLDRVEGGQRLDYGLKWGVFGAGGGSTTAFLGQSFRFRDSSPFGTGSGLEDKLSDLVGRVHVVPGPSFDLLYRFRLDKDDLRSRRSEVSFVVGPPALRLNTEYIFVDRRVGTGGFNDREEITLSASSQITRRWSAQAHGRRDLASGGMLSTGFGLIYEDECFYASANFLRTFTRDREIAPSNTIFFRFVFKNLGEVTL